MEKEAEKERGWEREGNSTLTVVENALLLMAYNINNAILLNTICVLQFSI